MLSYSAPSLPQSFISTEYVEPALVLLLQNATYDDALLLGNVFTARAIGSSLASFSTNDDVVLSSSNEKN